MDDFRGWRRIIKFLYSAPVMAWCGSPNVDVPGESCGCPVMGEVCESVGPIQITVDRVYQMEPAGKTRVRAESCPQGKW